MPTSHFSSDLRGILSVSFPSPHVTLPEFRLVIALAVMSLLQLVMVLLQLVLALFVTPLLQLVITMDVMALRA